MLNFLKRCWLRKHGWTCVYYYNQKIGYGTYWKHPDHKLDLIVFQLEDAYIHQWAFAYGKPLCTQYCKQGEQIATE